MINLKKTDCVIVDRDTKFEGIATGLVSSTVLDYNLSEVAISSTPGQKAAVNSIFEGLGTSMVSSTVFDI